MTMTIASLNCRAHTRGVTDDDIDPAARPMRRTFSAVYKAEIVAEYDSHPKVSEERGAILRREGLYTSHISERRKAAAAGAREGLAAKSKRGASAAEIELEKLRAKNEQLEAELAKTETALEITGRCTRSWNSSPRARTPIRGRRRDRRTPPPVGGGDVDESGM